MGSPMTAIQVDSERTITLKESEILYLSDVLKGSIINADMVTCNSILTKLSNQPKS